MYLWRLNLAEIRKNQMSNTQPAYPQTMRFESNIPNISYLVHIATNVPSKGVLSHTLMNTDNSISCIINCSNLLEDYKRAIFTISFKQVKSKSHRSIKNIAKMRTSNVLYRSRLDLEIKAYIAMTQFTPYTQTKTLLLNSLTDIIDQKLGDTGMQGYFRLERVNGGSDFFLCPGEAMKHLLYILGMTTFDSDLSVEDIIEEIHTAMTKHTLDHAIPALGLRHDSLLEDDIKRYISFMIHGN